MWLIIQSKIRQEERVRDESERVNEKNQVTQADPFRGCVHITYGLWMGGWVTKGST